MSKKELDKLIKGLKKRDNRTLKAFYAEFHPKVLGYIITRGGNDHDAKDIFQEAIIVVLNQLDKNKLNIQQDFGSYIVGVAKHIWLNQLRKASIHDRYVQQLDPEETVDHPSEVELEDEAEKALIRKYIVKLGEDCRNVLIWSSEGVKNAEIAERLEYKGEKTVRTKKAKCKKKLLEMISKDPKYKAR